VMLDPNEAQEGRANAGRNPEYRDAAGDRSQADRPLADREVPLHGMLPAEDGPALALNQWLDGDVTEADARRADSKQVELWNRIATETDRRKRMVTPAYVAANIMAALPEKRVEAQAATVTATATRTTVAADTERGLSMNMALAVGVGMFAIGLAVGKLVL